MKPNDWGSIIMALVIVAFVIGGCVVTVSVWNECRADNKSFFYCLRLISK